MEYLQKDKTRAQTRAYSNNKKENVKRWWQHYRNIFSDHTYDMNDESHKARIGKDARTPRCCSCHMCGNPRRKTFTTKSRLTLQELSFNEICSIVDHEEKY